MIKTVPEAQIVETLIEEALLLAEQMSESGESGESGEGIAVGGPRCPSVEPAHSRARSRVVVWQA